MKTALTLLMLFVGLQSFADNVRVDPTYLDNGVYNEDVDGMDTTEVQYAATMGACSAQTPVGTKCYCNRNIVHMRETPGWNRFMYSYWIRPGWRITGGRNNASCVRDN